MSSDFVSEDKIKCWIDGMRPDPINFKYNEIDMLQEIQHHIEKTYGQHYASEKGQVQVFDLLLAEGLEDFIPFSKWTAITYLKRFGKKKGYNREDLLKAAHYIVILLNATKEMKQQGE